MPLSLTHSTTPLCGTQTALLSGGSPVPAPSSESLWTPTPKPQHQAGPGSPLGLCLLVSQVIYCLSELLSFSIQTPKIRATPLRLQILHCPSAGLELRNSTQFTHEGGVRWVVEKAPYIPPHALEDRQEGIFGTFYSKAEKIFFSRPLPTSPFIKEEPYFFFVHMVYYLQGFRKFCEIQESGEPGSNSQVGTLRQYFGRKQHQMTVFEQLHSAKYIKTFSVCFRVTAQISVSFYLSSSCYKVIKISTKPC